MSSADTARVICDYQEIIQKGKRAGFDRLDAERISMRLQYRLPRPDIQPSRYVHDYRGTPFVTFISISDGQEKSAKGQGHEAGTVASPPGASDPLGGLDTTFTFQPGLFDEHCLARFLEVESEPDREDLAFLLERETRLGSVYAGVLVDHTQAGVEHSLRWDVLPVRIPKAKQPLHAQGFGEFCEVSAGHPGANESDRNSTEVP